MLCCGKNPDVEKVKTNHWNRTCTISRIHTGILPESQIH